MVKLNYNFCRPCLVPFTFEIRNFSATHSVQYLLRLSSPGPSTDSHMLPPTFAGRLTRKGKLAPSDSASVAVAIWATHPGAYSLNEWRMEVEVLEKAEETDLMPDVSSAQQRIRHRYEQGPSEVNRAHVTVIHCI